MPFDPMDPTAEALAFSDYKLPWIAVVHEVVGRERLCSADCLESRDGLLIVARIPGSRFCLFVDTYEFAAFPLHLFREGPCGYEGPLSSYENLGHFLSENPKDL